MAARRGAGGAGRLLSDVVSAADGASIALVGTAQTEYLLLNCYVPSFGFTRVGDGLDMLRLPRSSSSTIVDHLREQ